MENLLGYLDEIVYEDYCDILDTIPSIESYRFKYLYVPAKDKLIICIDTDNVEYRKFIDMEEASHYFPINQLAELNIFTYNWIHRFKQ